MSIPLETIITILQQIVRWVRVVAIFMIAVFLLILVIFLLEQP